MPEILAKSAELEQQLGDEFSGVLSSDDFSVYNGYPVKAQQKCLAHLRRHFKKVVKLGHGNNPALGQAFLDLINVAFVQHRHWRETKDSVTYRTWAVEFKSRVQQSLQQWLGKAGYEAGKLLRSLRDKAEQWWYFLDHPEVPPDNNLAERSLRLAVTKRKVSFLVACDGAVCPNGRPAECSPNLSPTGTVGHRVFQASFDGGVRQWQVPSISFALTQDLNPYQYIYI